MKERKETPILLEADDLVSTDRQSDYGAPEENFSDIAGLWSVYLGHPVDVEQVAVMMVLLKLARSKNRYKRDNFVDAAGYIKIADHLAQMTEVYDEIDYSKICRECGLGLTNEVCTNGHCVRSPGAWLCECIDLHPPAISFCAECGDEPHSPHDRRN